MTFVKYLAIAAGIVVASAIALAVICFVTGAGVQVPWLVEAPPRVGGTPSLNVSFEPLGLVGVTVAAALVLTMLGRRPQPRP